MMIDGKQGLVWILAALLLCSCIHRTEEARKSIDAEGRQILKLLIKQRDSGAAMPSSVKDLPGATKSEKESWIMLLKGDQLLLYKYLGRGRVAVKYVGTLQSGAWYIDDDTGVDILLSREPR